PTAQTLLAATAVTPVSRLLVVALRAGTMLQALPFQCSTRVRFCTAVLTMLTTLPTAQMLVGDRAEIAASWLVAAAARGGTGTIDQAVPFPCSPQAGAVRAP